MPQVPNSVYINPRRSGPALKSISMTGREAARRLGVGEAHFSQLLNGRISICKKRLAQLSELLGVSAEYLTGWDGDL